ncbi:MAG: ribonuclease H-like domain-containing protein [Lachnospiraceae bacterium]|nr:ribonuclease H-like domain-containing protein [Lachnospiraceae bacterium]
MKTTLDTIYPENVNIDLTALGSSADGIFIDIETTGLSSEHSYIYEIGLAYRDVSSGNYVIKQWIIANPSEEEAMLSQVISFISKYKTLIHFNGNTFDIPFMIARCKANGITCDFEKFKGIDIYRRISSLKHFLRLDSCRQKSIEAFLGIEREDQYSGKDLIKIYHEYISDKSQEKEKLLLLHNHDDMLGMLKIVPILSYNEMFDKGVVIRKVQTNVYNDVFGLSKKELIFTIGLPCSIPVAINYNACGCYFSAKGKDGIIKVPLFHEEMKYFYSNYHDYYYLPTEDVAVHKSVSEYVDKDFREPAKASTCYTRKVSDYLPQWDNIEFTPFFKRDYDSNQYFFELTDEFKTNKDAFTRYSNHILTMMHNYR